MSLDIETIKSQTVCPECNNNEMVVGYAYGDGSIHKKLKIFGAEAYQKASNSAMIICKNCGLVIKTYALDPQKL